jgi:exodeoxyribonuclease I
MLDKPFVYTSGKYNTEYEKTTVVGMVGDHPSDQGGALVFDLRYDPTAFVDLTPAELAEAIRRRSDEEGPRLPVKTIKFNRCPAIAPTNVLDEKALNRLNLDLSIIQKNHTTLLNIREEFSEKVKRALGHLDEHNQAKFIEDNLDADSRLYEGFFNDSDKTKMSLVRAADKDGLESLDIVFNDGRLQALLPLYLARNYPDKLNDENRQLWEQFKERRLLGGGADSKAVRFFKRLEDLSSQENLTSKNNYLLEELKLYAESILPVY